MVALAIGAYIIRQRRLWQAEAAEDDLRQRQADQLAARERVAAVGLQVVAAAAAVEASPRDRLAFMPSPPKGPPPGSFGLRVMNRLTALNVFLYRRTGGRIGGAIGNIRPIALVDHVGAKSGTEAHHAPGLDTRP